LSGLISILKPEHLILKCLKTRETRIWPSKLSLIPRSDMLPKIDTWKWFCSENLNFFRVYRNLMNHSNIENMLRTDFEHKKTKILFYKTKLRSLINYRSIKIKNNFYSIYNNFFSILNLISAPLFLQKVSYHIILRCEFHDRIDKKKFNLF